MVTGKLVVKGISSFIKGIWDKQEKIRKENL